MQKDGICRQKNYQNSQGNNGATVLFLIMLQAEKFRKIHSKTPVLEPYF